ncbi:hypothetical protein Btru_015746 [Bulinus truncatus]|nr:hypothetical protein Btru_015746 [Bulinus truncatus]
MIVDLISKDVSSPNKNGIKEKTNDKFSLTAEYLWSHCAENPGHTHFIPANKFRLIDLPIKYRKKCILDYIKRLSNVTVRIIVEKNPGRPGDTGYKHGRLVVAGTGTVTEILHESQSVKCGCQDCTQFNSHQRVPTNRVFIRILTAWHVVQNCFEAQNSTVDFFYDDATDKGNMITLRGVRMCENNVKEDWSVFECVTSDRNLVDKLQSDLDGIDHWSMHTAYEGGLAVIVSHPHGMSKHISIGRWIVDKADLLAEKRFMEEFAQLLGINLDSEYLLHILQVIVRRIMRSTCRAIVNKDKKLESRTDVIAKNWNREPMS